MEMQLWLTARVTSTRCCSKSSGERGCFGDSGNITLKSGSDFTLAGGITVTTGLGGDYATAGASVDTFANSRFINSTGDVVISAETVVNLGGVQSAGDVSIVSSTDSILRSGSLTLNVRL